MPRIRVWSRSRTGLFGTTLCLFCALLSGAAAADDGSVAIDAADDELALLQQAVANSRDWTQADPAVALEFRQIIEIDDGKLLRRQELLVDERLPPLERVSLVSVDGAEPDELALSEFRKQRQRDIERAEQADADDRRVSISFTQFDLDDARLIEGDADRLVFAVPNALRSVLGVNNADMAKHLQMQVEVDPTAAAGPYLRRLTVESTAPFKPGLIGKVERFRMQMDLMLHDSGRLVVERMDVDVRARALFRDIASRQQVIFTDYRAHAVAPKAAWELRDN